MLILFIIVWVLAAWLTAKTDAILTREPTSIVHFLGSLIIWPIIAIWICMDAHECIGGEYYE